MSNVDLIKTIWEIASLPLGIVLTGAVTFYFYMRSKRIEEYRRIAKDLHPRLGSIRELIGIYYAHGLEYPTSNPLKDSIVLAAKDKYEAMKLGRKIFGRWNQAISSAHQCHLAYKLHISGEAVDDWDVAYHSPDELVKDPERFYRSTTSAIDSIDLSIRDMEKILKI